MPPTPPALRQRWREQIEPRALTALALVAVNLPPLLLFELITARQAGQAASLLAWAAACLLLLRLPGLLRPEGRRVAALVLLGVAGLVVAVGTLWPRPVSAQSSLTFKASPRISQASFTRILTNAGSPAAPHGDELYSIIVSYGLDPAVALAFFQHESQYCTTGACARGDLRNWGMLRRAIKPGRSSGSGSGFVRYSSWQDGVRDWCELMLGYIGRGMDTVEAAVPVYAPGSDGNVPTAYISAIRRQVAAWSGRAAGDPTLRAYDSSLDQALITETFLASSLEFHPTWAFHTYLLSEARAGRPLGAPLDESRIVSVGGQRYAVQVFALDTLYTPLAPQEAETNWGDVRRLSQLLRQLPAPTVTPTGPPGP
ncbi:MAG: hypothetical protein OHK0015_00520 [Chloroflexi bacterium OHK40]